MHNFLFSNSYTSLTIYFLNIQVTLISLFTLSITMTCKYIITCKLLFKYHIEISIWKFMSDVFNYMISLLILFSVKSGNQQISKDASIKLTYKHLFF